MQKQLFLFLCVLTGFPLYAQEAAPTLKELLEQALNKSHKTEIADRNIELAGLDMQKLREAYLPVAEVSGQYGFMAQNGSIKTDATTLYLPDGAHQLPALDNGFTGTANLARAGLDIHSLVYSGGKVPAMKKALNEKISAQKVMVEKDRQQITEDVLKAYDQLALLDQVKVLLDDSQKRLDVHKKTAGKALEYGLITRYEYQKLEVAQGRLNHQRVSYEGQRDLLIRQLAMYTGIAPERLALLQSSLIAIPASGTGLTPANRPELLALDHVIQARQHQVAAAQSWWKPKVMASASAGYLNLFDARLKGKTELPYNLGYNTLTTQSFQLAPDIRVGIGFRWDIFDGFKGKRDVQKARLEVRIAELEREEAREMLDLNLSKAQIDLNTANGEIQSRKIQLSVAEQALAQATKEFKTGLIRSSDLIDAENDFLAASLDYQQALFNQRRMAFALLKATGSLQPENIQ